MARFVVARLLLLLAFLSLTFSALASPVKRAPNPQTSEELQDLIDAVKDLLGVEDD